MPWSCVSRRQVHQLGTSPPGRFSCSQTLLCRNQTFFPQVTPTQVQPRPSCHPPLASNLGLTSLEAGVLALAVGTMTSLSCDLLPSSVKSGLGCYLFTTSMEPAPWQLMGKAISSQPATTPPGRAGQKHPVARPPQATSSLHHSCWLPLPTRQHGLGCRRRLTWVTDSRVQLVLKATSWRATAAAATMTMSCMASAYPSTTTTTARGKGSLPAGFLLQWTFSGAVTCSRHSCWPVSHLLLLLQQPFPKHGPTPSPQGVLHLVRACLCIGSIGSTHLG